MKRIILLLLFWLAKIFVVLCYFDILIPFNMLYLVVFVSSLFGATLLFGPYKSKRDTNRIKTTIFSVGVFVLFVYLLLPVIEYVFIFDSFLNIAIINLILSIFILIIVIISVSRKYIEFNGFQFRWVYVSKDKYAAIIFTTAMIAIAIISSIYMYLEIPVHSIGVIAIVVAIPGNYKKPVLITGFFLKNCQL